MSKSDIFRYIGNVLLLSGYFFLLCGDLKVGLMVKCVGNIFVVPFAIKYKFWDILFIILLNNFFLIVIKKRSLCNSSYVTQARHQFFDWKLETRRQYLHPHQSAYLKSNPTRTNRGSLVPPLSFTKLRKVE